VRSREPEVRYERGLNDGAHCEVHTASAAHVSKVKTSEYENKDEQGRHPEGYADNEAYGRRRFADAESPGYERLHNEKSPMRTLSSHSVIQTAAILQAH
jgi:hypothetical protein